jgi:FK506-binding protein 2
MRSLNALWLLVVLHFVQVILKHSFVRTDCERERNNLERNTMNYGCCLHTTVRLILVLTVITATLDSWRNTDSFHAATTTTVSVSAFLTLVTNPKSKTAVRLVKCSTCDKQFSCGSHNCKHDVRKVINTTTTSTSNSDMWIHHAKKQIRSNQPNSPLSEIITDTSNNNGVQECSRRRSILRSVGVVMSTAMTSCIASPVPSAHAELIDATDIFANNEWSKSTTTTSTGTTTSTTVVPNDSATNLNTRPTDEITIRINRTVLQEQYNGRLGVELKDIEFRTNVRVRVQSIQDKSYASQLQIQPNWIVVSINDTSMERTNAEGVRHYLMKAIQEEKDTNRSPKDIVMMFRDPSQFQSQLRDMSTIDMNEDAIPTVTTQIGPKGDTTQRNQDGTVQAGRSVTTALTDQRIAVQQLQSSRLNNGLCTNNGADIDDLLEISYVGRIVETGQIFDGSAVLLNENRDGIPGRGNDISLFFVLGKQPLGQFPPSWDIGLCGMCAGERRRLIVPPVLAYGTKGLSRRNIPPNATLQYDITLISINGIASL